MIAILLNLIEQILNSLFEGVTQNTFNTHLSERQIGILITDHNVRDTLYICQRGYIMSEGKLICQGSPQEILNNEKVRQMYLGEEFDL